MMRFWLHALFGRMASETLRVAAQVLVSSVFAGIAATVAQMLLWWLEATPVIDTLLRDARLTAAIVMGRAVLAPEPAWRWDVLVAATVIHFALSATYAVIALAVVRRLRTRGALFAGAAFGLAIYVVNLHGFTLLFPWFEVARGWVTIVAHLVFGISLAWVCRVVGPYADATVSPPVDGRAQ